MGTAYVIVVGYSAAVVAAAWFLFKRSPTWRPWIGVIDIRDIAVLLGAFIAFPYLYLVHPGWVPTTVVSIVAALAAYSMAKRTARSRLLAVGVAVGVVSAEIAVAAVVGTKSNVLLLVNGAVLAPMIAGAASSIVKCGARARDVALLAGALGIYEISFRSHLTVAADLVQRANGRPFVPLFGWWYGSHNLAIGLFDLLLAAVFPLVAYKAFGRTAGLVALAASLAAIAGSLAFADGNATHDWPPMATLGPLVVVQYLWWIRRHGRERAMWEYLRRESLVQSEETLYPAPPVPVAGAVVADTD